MVTKGGPQAYLQPKGGGQAGVPLVKAIREVEVFLKTLQVARIANTASLPSMQARIAGSNSRRNVLLPQ
jgi:hypothetical protein